MSEALRRTALLRLRFFWWNNRRRTNAFAFPCWSRNRRSNRASPGTGPRNSNGSFFGLWLAEGDFEWDSQIGCALPEIHGPSFAVSNAAAHGQQQSGRASASAVVKAARLYTTSLAYSTATLFTVSTVLAQDHFYSDLCCLPSTCQTQALSMGMTAVAVPCGRQLFRTS